MKKMACLGVICAVAVMGSGCATTVGYFADRAFDLADVVTVTAGVGLGAKVRVGPCRTGLLYPNIDLIGLRSGAPFVGIGLPHWCEKSRKSLWLPDHYVPPPFAFLLGEADGLWDTSEIEDWPGTGRGKEISILSMKGHLFAADVGWGTGPEYYTQMEVVVGLGPSVRIGFNPGELLDFIVGWFGFHLYWDDIAAGYIPDA